MAFPFAKDPIGAIRPIEDMVRPSAVADVHRPAGAPNQRLAVALARLTLTRLLAPRDPQPPRKWLVEIAPPPSVDSAAPRSTPSPLNSAPSDWNPARRSPPGPRP